MSTWENLILKKEQWKEKTIKDKLEYRKLMYKNRDLTEALAAIIKCMEEGFKLENDLGQLVNDQLKNDAWMEEWKQFRDVQKEIDDTIETMLRGVNSGMTRQEVKEMRLKYWKNTNNPYLVVW